MKNKLLAFLMLIFLLPAVVMADDFVNLTPRPKTMNVTGGTLTLPASFSISCSGIDDAMQQEVARFADALRAVTGCTITLTADDEAALFRFIKSTANQKEGGYTIMATTTGVTVRSSEVLGTYYACQTLKKIMPPCVMAGVKDPAVTTFTLPCVNITDEPRFAYRGFMLDVARHFFTVDEVKRMLDVMSYYKLNRFHWHLSDDQGWRVEIKKYPRLTTIGATAPNSRFTDLETCTQRWINQPYGPYFYTQDEIRDVVAYARERHIEIIPEIDMPGHFCAAMAAYPEFSCTPYGNHSVITDGGIYNDILNVADPLAVQFAKDVVSELIDLFPYDYINIGGDECPTTAWEGNALCQARYKQLGLTSYRQLQSHFIKEMADFVQQKGKKLAVWNEAITASGADLDIMKQTGATVYCWTGADAAVKKAATMGLPRIYTPWGPYYINRRQGTTAIDPPGAGDGTDNVQKTYNTVPPTETDLGVQGTFWTEHVNDAPLLEWLALPRLLAIAEAGWTPQARKSFDDFQKRMSADTTLLNYGHYRYCPHLMLTASAGGDDTQKVMPTVSTDAKSHYYRIVSGATDARKDRCIELLAEGSSLIAANSGKGAAVGVLWTAPQAADADDNYDAQWWRLEEDAAHPGHYALVCKAATGGSVKPAPSTTGVDGRWSYDYSAKHYSFQLGTAAYGTKGDNHYYSIMSDELDGKYLNSSMAGQGMAVNVYADPASGGGGQWEFQPAESGSTPDVVENPLTLEEGKTYNFACAVEGYNDATLADNIAYSQLSLYSDKKMYASWTVTKSTKNADGSQTVQLKSSEGCYIGALGSFVNQNGWPVMKDGKTPADVVIRYVPADGAYRLLIDGHSLFAHPSGYAYAGATISGASYDAPRSQGAEWTIDEVTDWRLDYVDEQGNDLLAGIRMPLPVTATAMPESLCDYSSEGYELVKVESDAATHKAKAVFRRANYCVYYHCTDARGNRLTDEHTIRCYYPADGSHAVSAPEIPYYTVESITTVEGTVVSGANKSIDVVYSTKALTGARAVDWNVSQLKEGTDYIFYDASSDNARTGYRRIVPDTKRINRLTDLARLDPTAVWTLEGSDNKFRVKNACYDLYVPALQRSQATTAAATGAEFTFTYDSSERAWYIAGTNGMKWDGIEDGSLVGWNSGTGHPIRISKFIAQPYFTASLTCTTADGRVLYSTSRFVQAGDALSLPLPTLDGYALESVTGNETLNGTADDFYDVRAVYAPTQSGIATPVVADDASSRHARGIYDLQGRRLQRVTTPGVYVINGRKVVVR